MTSALAWGTEIPNTPAVTAATLNARYFEWCSMLSSSNNHIFQTRARTLRVRRFKRFMNDTSTELPTLFQTTIRTGQARLGRRIEGDLSLLSSGVTSGGVFQDLHACRGTPPIHI